MVSSDVSDKMEHGRRDGLGQWDVSMRGRDLIIFNCVCVCVIEVFLYTKQLYCTRILGEKNPCMTQAYFHKELGV